MLCACAGAAQAAASTSKSRETAQHPSSEGSQAAGTAVLYVRFTFPLPEAARPADNVKQTAPRRLEDLHAQVDVHRRAARRARRDRLCRSERDGGREECDRRSRDVRGHRHEHIEPHVHHDRRQDDRRDGRQVHRGRDRRPGSDRRDHPARPQRDQHDRQHRRRQRLAEDRSVAVGNTTRTTPRSTTTVRSPVWRRTGSQPVCEVPRRNLSADFSAASGFTGGKLGGGTSGGSAVEVGDGSCKSSRPTTEKSEAHGTISATVGDLDHGRRPDLRDPGGQVRRRERRSTSRTTWRRSAARS